MMDKQNAIEITNLSKEYRLGLVSTGTVSHDLNRWWHRVRGKEDPYLKVGETNVREAAGESEYVWALKDINLTVKKGEVLGIIGKNGAGKSTLLKILSKVTGPTTGEIKYRGRIGSLLEVGTGFHSELTGRENVYLNGAILGMTKNEVKRKFDDIVDFSGCARYVDTPVKRYSSGMLVRLGFAVAAFLEPEILVVDEVLAVGDAEFQKRAIGKMQEVSEGDGRTILFVSHNMASIKKLCDNCVLLENGVVSFADNPPKVIDYYLGIGQKFSIEKACLAERTDRQGSGLARFVEIELDSSNNNFVKIGEGAGFVIRIKSNQKLRDVEIVLSIYNKDGICITKTSTRKVSERIINLKKGENTVKCCFEYLPFQVGKYSVNLGLHFDVNICDWIERALFFDVVEDDIYKTGKFDSKSKALIFLPNEWQIL